MASDLKLLGQMYFINFQKDLDDLHQKQLYVIIDDHTATKQQIKDNIQTFFDGIGGDTLAKFNKLQTKLLFKQGICAARIKAIEDKLSEEAKVALEKAREIKTDFSRTPTQEKRQLSELYGSLSESAKNEVRTLCKIFGNEKWV